MENPFKKDNFIDYNSFRAAMLTFFGIEKPKNSYTYVKQKLIEEFKKFGDVCVFNNVILVKAEKYITTSVL